MTLDLVNNLSKARVNRIISPHPIPLQSILARSKVFGLLCVSRILKKVESQIKAYRAFWKNSESPYQELAGGDRRKVNMSRINNMDLHTLIQSAK